MIEETYIGDGVYASEAYSGIKLRTQRLDGMHYIFLGPNEWKHLVEFVERSLTKPPRQTEEG